MKIALLNLPYDNNYGGNLQRYALMCVLQGMGYDVTHINLRASWDYWLPKRLYLICKRLVRNIFVEHKEPLDYEKNLQKAYNERCSITEPFYKRYINHTEIIRKKSQLKALDGYNCYVVGSDQVWRKLIARHFGIKTFFLDFVSKRKNIRRIGYAVSLGTSENELTPAEIRDLGILYEKFDAVSVREKSALLQLSNYGWNKPRPVQVCDPVFLLQRSEYENIIAAADVRKQDIGVFAYLLDSNEDKLNAVHKYQEGRKSQEKILDLSRTSVLPSIEEWLSYFRDSEFIVTDSYHGMAFAIIFNKQFHIIKNKFRGMARFDSVLETFNLNETVLDADWQAVNSLINKERAKALDFLRNSIKA